jgi:hypothetical protein
MNKLFTIMKKQFQLTLIIQATIIKKEMHFIV